MASDDPHSRSTQARFHLRVFTLLIAAGCLLYGFALNYPFVFDDHIYLEANPLFKDIRNFAFFQDFSAFVKLPARLGLDPDLSANLILRPLTYLTFHANYVLDGMRPRGFRAVNIAIHIANALLVLQILSALLRAAPRKAGLAESSVRFIPATVAFAFIAHPLQTESVTYIIQRFTSLGALFYLSSILLYLKASASIQPARARGWKGLSILLYVLGLFSQETAVTIPIMIMAIDVFFMERKFRDALKRVAPYLIFLPVIPVLMFMITRASSDGAVTASGFLNIANTLDRPQNSFAYTLTQASAVLTYLRLILLPLGLNVDPDYPATTSILSARFLISVSILLVIVSGAWLFRRRLSSDARASLVFLMVVWYFATLSISSSIITLGDLMVEHRAYLPSLGAITALVCLLDMARIRLQDRLRARRIFTGLLVAWAVTLCVLTVMRNFTWRSNIVLWKNAAEQSPNKLRPWSNLGAVYGEARQFPEAVACTRRALQIEPTFLPASRNLGIMENTAGHYNEALAASDAGLRFWPRDFSLWYNKGVALHQLGHLDKAVEAFQNVVKEKPDMRQAHLLLAVSFTELRHYDKALKAYRDVNALAPLDDELKKNVAALEAELLRQHGFR